MYKYPRVLNPLARTCLAVGLAGGSHHILQADNIGTVTNHVEPRVRCPVKIMAPLVERNHMCGRKYGYVPKSCSCMHPYMAARLLLCTCRKSTSQRGGKHFCLTKKHGLHEGKSIVPRNQTGGLPDSTCTYIYMYLYLYDQMQSEMSDPQQLTHID